MMCKDCKHFRQHYIRYGRGCYRECNWGHCVFPRRKLRRPGTPACSHFQPVE